MHVEKNVFVNVLNIVMDIKNKTKNNVKARINLKKYCKWRELELQFQPSGKVLKPKTKFILSNEQKVLFMYWWGSYDWCHVLISITRSTEVKAHIHRTDQKHKSIYTQSRSAKLIRD